MIYKIKIDINNNVLEIENKALRILSEEFIDLLDNIAKKDVKYKNIIIKSRTNAFNFRPTEKSPKAVATSNYIEYSYQKNKSADDHFKKISELLSILKESFDNNSISFSYELTPDVWKSISRENKNIPNPILQKKIKRNLLYFGAPGTGKSFEIEKNTQDETTFRTMFHEEYSYFDFIGQYKPTVSEKSSQGSYTNAKGVNITGKEPVILYDYIPGDFIKAYVEAKKNPEKKVYFIIEEINRGNCAAIFGDVFQLLDRDDNNESKYPISTPVELSDYLNSEHVTDFKSLSLPSNLFLIGTMNTSDQSLYPMDSAFKRRWDMKFVCINYYESKLKSVKIENTDILWLDFLASINDLIGEKLESENKMIGQWFIKPENGIILEDDFKNKVLNYLYYDVFKHDRKAVFKDIQYSIIFKKDIKQIIKTLMRKNEN